MNRTRWAAIGAATVSLLACSASASAQTAKPPAQAAKPSASDDVTRDTNLRAYAELIRSDIRSQKVAIITEVMQFTEAEDAKFWPIYREYEAALARINDDRMAMIAEYADTYEALTDASADKLATSALELGERRQALQATYYERFKSVLPAKTAARFMQVEHQLLLILDLQIAAALPIASR